MCGIYGGIGKIDYSIIRALAIANIERGHDSMGYFDNRGSWIKQGGEPMELLAADDFTEYLSHKANRKWIVGHNRHGTRGLSTTENAHPFVYGKIIGCHNGIVTAPSEYAVDSEYLFDLLNIADNDYQAALDDIGGYWGLAWSYDGELFLQAHNNTIALAEKNGSYYFSSDVKHLQAAIGKYDELSILKDGTTIKFNTDNVLIDLPDFKSTYIAPPIKKYPYTGSNNYLGYTYKERKETENTKWYLEDENAYIQCDGCGFWYNKQRIMQYNNDKLCERCFNEFREKSDIAILPPVKCDDIMPNGVYCERCYECFPEKDITYRNQEALCPRCLEEALDLAFSQYYDI